MKDTVKHTTLKGAHFLTVTPDGRKDFNQLAITFNTGTGENWKETDRAQVSIWIAKEPIFEGTFEDLKKALQAETGNENFLFKPGQPVNWAWGKFPRYTVIKRHQDNGENVYTLADPNGALSVFIKETQIQNL